MTAHTPHTKPGVPLPLGPTWSEAGVNFALFSRNARSVSLVFRHKNDGLLQEITLDPELNKTGDIWHIFLKTGGLPICYGYRVEQQPIPGWPDDSAEHVVIDPYCTQHLARRWGAPSEAGREPVCLAAPPDSFDWQGDRPLRTPASETIIYELHVRGFTRHSSAHVQNPGTFSGIVEKIPYLKDLGVTAVELLPVTEWDETDNRFISPATGELLLNYWGYNPLSFFALRSGLAANPDDAVNEFKIMVKHLHQAGIEVILDLVFNHTGESDIYGTTSGFRAIDNQVYYLINPATNDYLNYSGCGNTVNTNHPVVSRMIIDALRYFAGEFHIDGFRFDLASIFNRATDGSPIENSPLVEMIAEDPVLRDCKIIAEAWDAAGLYQVGSFSANRRWREWNGKYRDDVRTFISGAPNSVHNLATRIAGSSDLYQDDTRGPLNSVNFITCHDGFTLYDLVSYNQKYNEENGEGNRDGENHNLSWNSGFEGAPAPERIERLRLRRIKTMAALLFLSQGIPMVCTGDEVGRSQQGNNNTWCQDNETSWFNWTFSDAGSNLKNFFVKCIALRSRYEAFRRRDFFKDSETLQEIIWQSLKPGVEDWSAECRELGFLLNGDAAPEGTTPAFFIMVNGSRQSQKSFTIPRPADPQNQADWLRIVDTALPGPDDFVDIETAPVIGSGSEYPVEPMALVILQTRIQTR